MTTVVNVRFISKSWRDDPGYVYCGRPGKGVFPALYGNPHVVGWCQRCQARHDRDEVVALFDREARARYAVDPTYRAHIARLRGKRLVCFCAPASCHCDTYVSLLENADVFGGRFDPERLR